MELHIKFVKLKNPLGYSPQGIRLMEDRLHGLVSEEDDAVGLKVQLKLLNKDDKSEDELFQSCVSGLNIMEDLANVIDRLLDLPFLPNEHHTYRNRRYSEIMENFIAKLRPAQQGHGAKVLFQLLKYLMSFYGPLEVFWLLEYLK